jgi:hypothetical protein
MIAAVCRSSSWNGFSGPDAPQVQFVFTVRRPGFTLVG